MNLLSDLPAPIVRLVIGMWTRRWLIIAMAWGFALIGWVVVALLPDYYTSRAQIYVDTDTALNETLQESERRDDVEKRVRVMRLQLLSRGNMAQVIDIVGLDEEIAAKAAEEADTAGERERIIDVLTDRTIASLSENIRVESTEEQYYTISYADKNPVMAQRIVAAVIDLFSEGDVVSQRQTALSRLDREIERYEAMLSEKDREIAAFRREHADELASTENTSRRLDRKEIELSGIDYSIQQAERRRQTIMGELARVPERSSGEELDALKLQLAQLQSQFRDNYPDIISLKARIEELESGRASLPVNPEYRRLEDSLRATEDELAVMRERQARLRREIDELTLTASLMPEVRAELQEIMRSYEQVEKSYNDLLAERARQSITASLSEGGGRVEYKVYEEPKIAAEPSSPKRGLFSLGVLVLACGGGVGGAFLMAQLDRTYAQRSDLEQAFGLPVLGSVSPAITPKLKRRRAMERMAMAGAAALLVVAGIGLFWFQSIHVSGEGARLARGDALEIRM